MRKYRQGSPGWWSRKRNLLVILCFGLMVTLAGCTAREEPKQQLVDINVAILDEFNTNYTGFFVAMKKGYFAQAGLQVNFVETPEGAVSDFVNMGGADFGVVSQQELAENYGSGQEFGVTAVSAITQHNTMGILSLENKNINSIKALEDHSFATSESIIEQKMIQTIMEENGADFGRLQLVTTYVDDVQKAIESDVDCVYTNYDWEVIKCNNKNMETSFFSIGALNPNLDYYSSLLVGNQRYLEENKDVAKLFVDALKKGYEYAAEAPVKSAKIYCEYEKDADLELIKESQRFISDLYLDDNMEFGKIDAKHWNMFTNWLNSNRLVPVTIQENTGFTNEFVE